MSADPYRMPPEHLPRARKEIEDSSRQSAMILDNPHESVTRQIHVAIEVLLDIRDLLAELAVGMSEVRSNTEAVGVRAETLLPAQLRADPPYVEVTEHHDAHDVNGMIANGWTLLGGSVDPHGGTHFLLARRAERPGG